METPTPSPSTSSPLPIASGALQPSWRPHWLWWLISALSGTLDIEADIVRLRQESKKDKEIAEQTRKETEQIENEILRVRKDTERIENEILRMQKEDEQRMKEDKRLIELISKIDLLLSNSDMPSNPPPKTEEP